MAKKAPARNQMAKRAKYAKSTAPAGRNLMGRIAASSTARGAKAGVNAKLNAGTPNLNEVA